MTLWLLGAVIAFWCGLGAFTFWSLRGATILRANQPASPFESSPKVSIIVAARNEEDALPAALESMLALDYPDYEIVLVDDDSRDRTGAIADEWAAKPSAKGRLKIIHNKNAASGLEWQGPRAALGRKRGERRMGSSHRCRHGFSSLDPAGSDVLCPRAWCAFPLHRAGI